MSWNTEARSRLQLGLARLLSEEPGLVVAVGEPWAGKGKEHEWLACLPASRLEASARPSPAAGTSGAGVQPLERLLAGCSKELEEIFQEVSLDPCGRRAFCGPMPHLDVSGSGASEHIVLDYRNALLPSAESEDSSSSPAHRRLAVLCLVVDTAPKGPEEVLHINRRLDQVHCIVAKLLATAVKAEVAQVLQPGSCVFPSASFSLLMMDQEPFGTRGMQEAFPASMLATLFPPPKHDLSSGVYCARLRGRQEYGVLIAAAASQSGTGRASSELCFFSHPGMHESSRFLTYDEASSAASIGGVLEDVRWLRPFYHGMTRFCPERLWDLVTGDMHAAVRLLWPGGEDCSAAPRRPTSTLVPQMNIHMPLPLHLLAQDVLSYASTADLGAWAPTGRYLGLAAERCVPAALAADVAVAPGEPAAAIAAAISQKE